MVSGSFGARWILLRGCGLEELLKLSARERKGEKEESGGFGIARSEDAKDFI